MERQASPKNIEVNNAFYDELGDGWYQADDHPIALLRKENECRASWVLEKIENHFSKSVTVLDIGCGGGFLSNDLALQGHKVTGIDLSESSLEAAKRYDKTKSVQYLRGDACALPFQESSFDVVCAMDILEHIQNPELLIHEASRVLRPDGLFFFHTFNRTWLSYLMAVKGLEWVIKNAPSHIHVYDLFIKPKKLIEICEEEHLHVQAIVGLNPNMKKWAFWKMLLTRKVPKDFQFCFSKNLMVGYVGVASKIKN